MAYKRTKAVFWDSTNLQSLCTPCHNAKTLSEKDAKKPFIKGCDRFGMPLDPRHPAWAMRE